MRQPLPYITKDGSWILELINPEICGSKNISVAEATVEKGKKTFLHVHKNFEEVYYILEGEGLMFLDDKKIFVKPQDVILIPANIPHCIKNIGEMNLKILCVCSPPYSHEDTEVLDS